MLHAGVSLPLALEQLQSTSPRAYQRATYRLAQRVGPKGGLANALLPEHALFPPFVSKLIGASESSGHLPHTLRELAHHFDEEARFQNQIKGVMIWPGIVLGGVAVTTLVLGPFVNGMFTEGMEGLVDQPQGLIPAGPGGFSLILLGLHLLWKPFLRRIPPLRAVVEGLLGITPLVAGYRRRLARARLLGTLHMGIEAGLLLPDALVLAGEASGEKRTQRESRHAADGVRTGLDLMSAMKRIRLMDLLGRGAMSTWGKSGSSEGLASLAKLQRSEARMVAKGIVGGVRVLTLLLAAVLVGMVVTSFYANYFNEIMKIID